MKVILLTVFAVMAVCEAACGQLLQKERNPAYFPLLHQSRTSVVTAIGEPESLYLPESDRYEVGHKSERRWLTTPVAETYRREYGEVPFEMDIFYETDNYPAGILGPRRIIGVTLTSSVQVHYPDVLPSIPWFKALCSSECDVMEYTADGEKYSMVCPTHPTATDLSAALHMPRTPCIRVTLTKDHPGFLIIQYADFLPAAEELMADGPVQHKSVNMEGVQ